MTDEWNGNSLATALAAGNPDAIESYNRTDVWVKGEHILQICFANSMVFNGALRLGLWNICKSMIGQAIFGSYGT